jgi:hypothetical protein
VITVEPAEGFLERDLREIRRAHGRLVRCYARLLRERPGLDGGLRFSLRINENGRVEAAEVSPESEVPGALVRCLEGVMAGLRFAPDPGARRLEGRLRLAP